MHTSVQGSTIYKNQDMKAKKYPSTDEQIKMWYLYTINAIQPQKRIQFAIYRIWMDLEGIMLSEINQRKINTYDITYMCNLKNTTN